MLITGGRALTESMAANCQLTGQLAERLGLGETVQRSLQQVFAMGRPGNARRSEAR